MAPIVSCILRFWMQQLPESTKDALSRYAQMAGGAGAAAAAAAAAAAVTSHQHHQTLAASSGAAAASGAANKRATPLPVSNSDIGNNVVAILAEHDCNGENTDDKMLRFANELDLQLRTADERRKLLEEISKESHIKLRADLLTGKMTIATFVATSKYDLLSPEELDSLKEHAKALAFRAAEGKNERIGDALFECEECGERNATHYEIQIRSADEPATVFLECLECGHNWREG